MDVWVNSRIQSPLERTLATVPVKAGAYTHNIPDNAPAFSMTKLLVKSNETAGFNSTHTIDIPQYGYLNKVVLKYTVNGGSPTDSVTSYNGGLSMTDTVQLKSRNRPIQTMYGRSIFARYLYEDVSRRDRKLSIAEWREDSGTTVPPSATHGSARSGLTTTPSMISYVELPLASTLTPAHNYNTRFVEPLQLTVRTNGITSIQMGGFTDQSIVSVEALFYFVNYHDMTEVDIRNANYRPEAPAVVLSYDEQEQPTGTVSAYSPNVPDKITITSKNLAYAMYVFADQDSTASTAPLQEFKPQMNVELVASGQSLYSGTGIENMLVDKYDHALSTHSNRSNEGSAGLFQNGTSWLPMATASNQPTVTRLQFGMSSNEAFNSGALGLQTLSNPEVRVNFISADTDMRLRVYVLYHALVQIDSGTGAISRSLDA
jgi:hypothetical protein